VLEIQKVEHLFRHEYGKIVSLLTGWYSSRHIELIEDAVQDALLKAMQIWGYQKPPGNPSAWLYRVANNRIIDQLRRSKKVVDFETVSQVIEIGEGDPSLSGELADNQLKMIFACCHPELSRPQQVMLSLKLLCGLSIREISRAFMKKDLFYAIRADLEAAAGLKAEAVEDLRRATDLAENAVERRFLESKMRTL
jgi:RNA polymerase sigma factor (sigma-70 family)